MGMTPNNQFLFQTGAIRSLPVAQQYQPEKVFLFQTGAIKRNIYKQH